MSALGNAKIFGKNLRRYIDQSGKLDKEVAEAVGVSTATMSEWLNGKKYPRINRIELLAQYFGIQKSDLIEDHTEDDADRLTRSMLLPDEAKFLSITRRLTPEQKQRALDMMLLMFPDPNDKKK